MIKLFSALIFSIFIPLTAAAADYSDGNGYTTIKTPVRTADPSKVEVTEIFWYGCPHCYSLEPITLAWEKNAPSDVDFKFLPAVFGRNWLAHAKAFYVADLLGIEDKVRADIFNTIHVERRPLNSEDALASFFAKYDVSEDEFRKLYNSFAVNSRLSQADAKIRAYGARGVPGLIVNGKYLVSAQTANGNENIYKVVDFLIEKERQEK
ncbi:thiol:disulfide interchange protein [Marinomonas ushuaiensis DSM 15871]|uniref:Thiol:disulfide interchange protein n=1 Tax=Marinomonas ushuaiensis DSM 15871 TaxID=1122207 RepID=X7EBF1_9GAMM|nr:thiol:disulfide interchange protein DsbA/DsbL [Marinomonas ushuaiensis]ETX12541.1 thiol:disulfide interchange protein [Marinomonas ushuaiensis DSM 15871]